jgi:predicted TIM-barrel fold metal-dependent hydrolase
VDADVHTTLPAGVLAPALPPSARRRFEKFGLRTLKATYLYPRGRNRGFRADAWPETGTPGSDLDLMRVQLLDGCAVDVAVLNPMEGLEFGSQDPEFAAALTSTLNDWTGTAWLDRDPRLRAGITVPYEDGALAAREIHRLGPDPRFVHVYLGSRTEKPLGHRKYWPLYEAAVTHGLAVTVHIGPLGTATVTGAGWPSFYFASSVG